jgi:hypothetical protein
MSNCWANAVADESKNSDRKMRSFIIFNSI